MIDHLIRCATAEDAEAMLRQYKRSRAHLCRVVLADAVWDETDPEAPVLVTPEVVADGHHVWVALPALDAALRDLPDHACRLIADRDAANTGQSFLVYVAPDIDLEALSSARVDPTFAGASYPFGEV